MQFSYIRLAIPFICGMIGANFFCDFISPLPIFVCSSAFLAIMFVIHFILKEGNVKKTLFIITATLFATILGAAIYTHHHHIIANSLPSDTTQCIGVLEELPKEKAKSYQLKLKQANGTHIIIYAGKNKRNPQNDSAQYSSLCIGDTIRARIKHLSATNKAEGQFAKYRTYLFHNDVCATAYTPPQQWSISRRTTPPSLIEKLSSTSVLLHTVYEQHGIAGDEGSIIEAMTIGRKDNLTQQIRTKYSASGVSHILALSGFHIGIITFILQLIFLSRITQLRWRWVANIAIIILLWVYATVTGLSPSIVRATIMFSIIFLCHYNNRSVFTLNSCAIAATIMLCINPFWLNSVGFQLSFISVAAISLYCKRIESIIPNKNRILSLILQIVVISAVCSIATAPLVAYNFGIIPLLSILTNLAIYPFAFAIIAIALLWWIFLWQEEINSTLTDILIHLTSYMNSITEWVSSLPFSSFEWHPSIVGVACSYLLLLLIHMLLSVIFGQKRVLN